MVGGSAGHEIRTHSANLCAIQQRYQVLGLGMTTAAVKDMCSRLGTDLVALKAGLDAVLHALVHLLRLHMLLLGEALARWTFLWTARRSDVKAS